MPVEEGTITKVEKDKAWVLVRRTGMCDNCGSKGACHTLGGGKDLEAEAYNTAGAQVGDRVRLHIKRKSFLKITFIVYLLPAIALIAGALWGKDIGAAYSIDTELAAVVTSFTAFAVSMIIVILFGKVLRGKRNYMPEVTKVIEENYTLYVKPPV